VVQLVALLQTAQDRDGVLDVGWIDQDRLEAALERAVLLDMLAVLVERGGADAVELAPRQQRLEQVARVHRTLGGAGAHDGVQLVDEEQHLPLALLHLVQDGLQALLELAPVLGARDQRAHVQRDQAPILEPLRHVAAHDALRQPLDDGGLPDPRVADQDGVVLGLARKDPDAAADLVVASDHRIELAVARRRDQVAAVLLERLVGLLGIRARHALRPPHVGERLQEPVAGHVEVGQQASRGGGRILLEKGQDEVLDRDVLVPQALGLLLGPDDELGEALGDVDLARLRPLPRHARLALKLLVELGAQDVGGHVHLLEQPGNEPPLLLEQGEEEVLAVHLRVAVADGQILSRSNRLLALLRKPVQIHVHPTFDAQAARRRGRSQDVCLEAGHVRRGVKRRGGPPPIP
jgi:hypothetical protein